MPKIKTNKSMAKRVKVTKSWKFIHKKAGVSHLLTNKWDSPEKDSSWREFSHRESHKVKNLIPYKLR